MGANIVCPHNKERKRNINFKYRSFELIFLDTKMKYSKDPYYLQKWKSLLATKNAMPQLSPPSTRLNPSLLTRLIFHG